MSNGPIVDVDPLRTALPSVVAVADETGNGRAVADASKLLAVIPQEHAATDSRWEIQASYVESGDTVLNLNCGTGKFCYVVSQLVGREGRVIGVDSNFGMLELARKQRPEAANRLGYANVEFRCGLSYDLRLDLDVFADALAGNPAVDQQSWLALRSVEERLRREQPMIEDNSINCALLNCEQTPVHPAERKELFSEIFRVLKPNGSAVVTEVVADEDLPAEWQRNESPQLAGLAGTCREDLFLKAFEEAGFHGIEIVARESKPRQTLAGIEFRSMTVTAYKGKHGPCLERLQAVIYRGPFSKVQDDDGHQFYRGERMAVCDKTFRLLQRAPYAGMFEQVAPTTEVPLLTAAVYDCRQTARRSPRETKGSPRETKGSSEPQSSQDLPSTTGPSACCGPNESCC